MFRELGTLTRMPERMDELTKILNKEILKKQERLTEINETLIQLQLGEKSNENT